MKIFQFVVNENKDKTVFFGSEFLLAFVENTDFFNFSLNESVLFLIWIKDHYFVLSTVLSFRVIPTAEERYFTFSTGLQTQGAQKSSKLHCLRARLKLNIQITILRLKLAPYEYGSISLLRNSFHASSRIKYLNMTVKTTAKKRQPKMSLRYVIKYLYANLSYGVASFLKWVLFLNISCNWIFRPKLLLKIACHLWRRK